MRIGRITFGSAFGSARDPQDVQRDTLKRLSGIAVAGTNAVPTLSDVMSTARFEFDGSESSDQVFAAALLWLLERHQGIGACWPLRQALRRIVDGPPPTPVVTRPEEP